MADDRKRVSEKGWDEKLAKIMVARNEIIKTEGDAARSVHGTIKCPVCTVGNLNYAIAYNGHVHASCSSEGCVQWME